VSSRVIYLLRDKFVSVLTLKKSSLVYLFYISWHKVCSEADNIGRFVLWISREATHRFRTSNNAKSNPEIKGRNSIFLDMTLLQVSGHALFTSTPHVFLLNIFINTTERSIHFYWIHFFLDLTLHCWRYGICAWLPDCVCSCRLTFCKWSCALQISHFNSKLSLCFSKFSQNNDDGLGVGLIVFPSTL
jgi:hypothetical protein